MKSLLFFRVIRAPARTLPSTSLLQGHIAYRPPQTLFLKHNEHASVSGPLHLVLLLPGRLVPLMSPWLSPSYPSGSVQMSPSPGDLPDHPKLTGLPPSMSVALCGFLFLRGNGYHLAKLYVFLVDDLSPPTRIQAP